MVKREYAESMLSAYLKNTQLAKNLSEKSTKAYLCDIEMFLNRCRNEHIQEIDADAVLDFIKWRTEQGIKDTTIKRAIISLKSYFKYLENSTIRSPLQDFAYSFKTTARLPKVLSKKEITKLLTLLADEASQNSSDFKNFIAVRDLAVIELLYL